MASSRLASTWCFSISTRLISSARFWLNSIAWSALLADERFAALLAEHRNLRIVDVAAQQDGRPRTHLQQLPDVVQAGHVVRRRHRSSVDVVRLEQEPDVLAEERVVSTAVRAAAADRRDRNLLLLEQARLAPPPADTCVSTNRSAPGGFLIRSLPYASTAD